MTDTDGANPWRWCCHDGPAQLVASVAVALREALCADCARQGEAWLLLSGGSTPGPIYRAVAGDLPEACRLTVTLVDERWVGPEDAGSNARLIRETLLARAGSNVQFRPLAQQRLGLTESVKEANLQWRAQSVRPSLVLLGMGEDGHTASLFPGSADLARALASPDPYAAVDARACAGAGRWGERITLTPEGWKSARRRLLVIRGATKRAVFERAARERSLESAPVVAAMTVGDAPLVVHWCP